MFLMNGKKLSLRRPFTIGSGDDAIQYPANWLELSSADERAAVGIVEVPDPVWPDGQFYDAVENEDGTLTVTPKPREQTITVMWNAIKAERDRRKYGGFKVVVGGEDKWFHSDEPSRNQYGVMLTTAIEKGLPVDFVFDAWKTMDGTKLPMTVELVRRIRDAGMAMEKQHFNNAEIHKAAMEASSDPAAYDFSTGWPKVFGEA